MSSDSKIHKLLDQLRAREEGVWEPTIKALIGMGEEVARAMPAVLLSADAADALIIVSCIGEPAIEALVDCLQAAGDLRLRAIEVLRMVRPLPLSSIQPLIDCLGDKEMNVQAAKALANAASLPPRAAEPLARCLDEPDSGLRYYAVKALARVHPLPLSTVSRLTNCICDPDWSVRMAAIDGLHDSGLAPSSAVQAIVRCLSDSSTDVQSAALRFLEDVDQLPDCAIPALRRVMDTHGVGFVGYCGANEDPLYLKAEAMLKKAVQGISLPPAEHRGHQAPNADAVDCTVFAPPEALAGDRILVQIFAHKPEQVGVVGAAAEEFDESTCRRGVTSLGTSIAYGSQLTFKLDLPCLMVDEVVQHLTWWGSPNSVQFGVSIPAETRPQTVIGTVLASQDTVPIGKIKFKLKVVCGATVPDSTGEPTGDAKRYQKAFISYAATDRPEVLRRVQMLTASGIQYFQDVLDLDPGARWQQELYRHIDESDVLFLFWSTAARESEWVAREWRYGLEKKGEDFIHPVIIEGPPIIPPPPELAHLHFDDRVLYVLRASEDKA